MIEILNVIANQYDLVFVLLALFLCVFGGLSSAALVGRTLKSTGGALYGWAVLSVLAQGMNVWSVHFILVLAFKNVAAVTLDPGLTLVAMLMPFAGAAATVTLDIMTRGRIPSGVGGAITGASYAAMMWIHMLGYNISGASSWSLAHVAGSVLWAVILSALVSSLASGFSHSRYSKSVTLITVVCFVAMLFGMHFIAMAGLHVVPAELSQRADNSELYLASVVAVTVIGLFVIGTGATTFLIDHATRSAAFRRLHAIAMTDTLTQLPNRNAFMERLSRDAAVGDTFIIAAIGLNQFKMFNDFHGQEAGDAMLLKVAAGLSTLKRDEDLLARIGGDEFGMILSVRDQIDSDARIAAIEKTVAASFTIDALDIAISAGVGVALAPRHGDTADKLIANAMLAMTRAKAEGAGDAKVYDPSMDEAIRARIAMAADLRIAIEAGQLALHYQPQVRVESGEITGFEALLRWRHPRHGPVSPAAFISVAEEFGLIRELGDWVLHRACEDAAGWRKPWRVAVNVSPIQLGQSSFAQRINEVLLDTGLPAGRLEVELTETAIIRDRDRSLQVLRQIKALGVQVALDDFGTGYSSLEILRAFAFDKIKLDRFFMNEVESSTEARAVLRSVMALGANLRIPVLAEGVETARQLEILAREGCDEAQGYLLGRPRRLEAEGFTVEDAQAMQHHFATAEHRQRWNAHAARPHTDSAPETAPPSVIRLV